MSYTIDDMHNILNEIVNEMEDELFEGLNGGIILVDEIHYHDEALDNDLLVLGDYNRFGVIKRINIYFGSIKRKYPHFTFKELKEKLKQLIDHELRHHWEYRAGVNDLIKEDEEFIREHKKRRDEK